MPEDPMPEDHIGWWLAQARDGRPPGRDVESHWRGHVPFARAIVRAQRPAAIVELGTYRGLSYGAFCDAVIEEGLGTACTAVDSWRGDLHMGAFPEALFEDVRAWHDARYAGFSRLMRMPFDEAAPAIPDGGVDLLHIDGCHGFEAVRDDFNLWKRKLSPRGVILFHDVCEWRPGFGVWRLWAALSRRYPSFLFEHGHGLGVLGYGPDQAAPLRALFAAGPAETRALRAAYAVHDPAPPARPSPRRRLKQALRRAVALGRARVFDRLEEIDRP